MVDVDPRAPVNVELRKRRCVCILSENKGEVFFGDGGVLRSRCSLHPGSGEGGRTGAAGHPALNGMTQLSTRKLFCFRQEKTRDSTRSRLIFRH